MVNGGNHTSQISMVDDVLGGIWSKGVIERDGEKTLRHASKIWFLVSFCSRYQALKHTGDLPFWSVVAEKTDTELSSSDTNTVMEDSDTSTKVLSALVNGLVILPGVSTKGL
jgi:hypothetical protein